MYYATPYRYFLDGFLGVAAHGQKVRCGSTEFARFRPPPGQNCTSYTSDFTARVGGYVQDGINGFCEYCQYENGDQFNAGFNVYYKNKWLDYGVLVAFCGFNFAVVFVCSWLYLGGMKTVREKVSPAKRRQKKAREGAGQKA